MKCHLLALATLSLLLAGCAEDKPVANHPPAHPAAALDPAAMMSPEYQQAMGLGGETATADPAASEPGENPADDSKSAGDETGEVTLEIVPWDDIQAAIDSQRGKVVVVDLWSTSCLPCIKEFPGLVELHKQYPDKVVCISVSCDYDGIKDKPPETYRDKVLGFLKEKNAAFKNFLCSNDLDYLFEHNIASLPTVYVYAADGDVKRFDNDEGLYGDEGFTYKDHIAPYVESLLSAE